MGLEVSWLVTVFWTYKPEWWMTGTGLGQLITDYKLRVGKNEAVWKIRCHVFLFLLPAFCLTWGKSPPTTRWKWCKTLMLKLISLRILWSSARAETRWQWCVDIRIPTRSSSILVMMLSSVSLSETVWHDHRTLLFAIFATTSHCSLFYSVWLKALKGLKLLGPM